MKIETKKVKLSEIKLNPDNPRTISEKQMANLVKSLKEFPDMMKLREIVVDEDMLVLGGNMRLLALQQAGADECIAKIATGLTADQKREFIIKDNANFGEWDMDVLANSWDDLPLPEWGIDLPKAWSHEPLQLAEESINTEGQENNLIAKLIIPKEVWFDSKEKLLGKMNELCNSYGIQVEWPE